MKIVAESREIDLRVSSMPTLLGENSWFASSTRRTSAFARGPWLPRRDAREVQRVLTRYGLVLVTGPTGSGKTTTLYSPRPARSPEVNIVTVEDPVEYHST